MFQLHTIFLYVSSDFYFFDSYIKAFSVYLPILTFFGVDVLYRVSIYNLLCHTIVGIFDVSTRELPVSTQFMSFEVDTVVSVKFQVVKITVIT